MQATAATDDPDVTTTWLIRERPQKDPNDPGPYARSIMAALDAGRDPWKEAMERSLEFSRNYVYQPRWYFFYDTLRDPEALKSVLSLGDTPKYESATIHSSSLAQYGPNLALLKGGPIKYAVRGLAYLVERREDEKTLDRHAPRGYRPGFVQITFDNQDLNKGWLECCGTAFFLVRQFMGRRRKLRFELHEYEDPVAAAEAQTFKPVVEQVSRSKGEGWRNSTSTQASRDSETVCGDVEGLGHDKVIEHESVPTIYEEDTAEVINEDEPT
jgi:hypothetical protein